MHAFVVLVRNQDDELNFRLIQNGSKIWLDPYLGVKYYTRATLKGLWKQYFQYGLYKIRVIQKRRGLPSLRSLIPSLFVSGLIFTMLLSIFTHQWAWFIGYVSLYAINNVAFSVWVVRRSPWLLFMVPVVFFVLHVSYELGFIFGIWRWRRYFLPWARAG